MGFWDRVRLKKRRWRFGRFITWMSRRTVKREVSPEAGSRSEAVDVVPVSPNLPTSVDDDHATPAESLAPARSSSSDTYASSRSRKQTSPRESTAAALALLSSRASILLSVIYPKSLYSGDSADPLFAVEVDHGRKNPNVEDTVLISSYFDDVRVYRQTYTHGIPRIIKRGLLVKVEEAEITHWIRLNTTIPVPQVLRIATYGSSSKIEFEYIEGSEELEKAWPSLDAAARATIADELVKVLKGMQGAPHPADGLIASYQRERAAALHSFNRPEWPPYTPTSSVTGFFDWARRCALASGMSPATWDSEIAPHIRLDTRIVLTHGDLQPRNILVRDGHLAALIDWELAGWWPEELEAAIVLRAFLDRPTEMAAADNEVAACWFIADCIDRARAGDEGDVSEQSRRREWAKFLLHPSL